MTNVRWYLEGNAVYSTVAGVSNAQPGGNSTWIVDRNVVNQMKPVLVPYGPQQDNKIMVTAYWIRALPVGVIFCFRNNSASGLPLGARFTDMLASDLATCLTPPNAVNFPDYQRFLRALALEGQCSRTNASYGVNGSKHDFEYGFGGTAATELYNEVIYCDQCCPPQPPSVC